MEKSLCLLAALVFLAGFLGAALTDDALTEGYALSNDTTTTSTTITTVPTVPATTQDSRRNPVTSTIAPSQSAGTSSGVKQSHSKDSRRDREEGNSKEEEDSREDDKTQLGRRRIKSKGNTKLINPHY